MNVDKKLFISLCLTLIPILVSSSSLENFASQRALLQTNNTSDVCCSQLSAIGFTSNLPVIIIDSHGKDIPHGVKTFVSLCTCANGASFKDFKGMAEAKGRGTSSANFTKKSYELNLISETNQTKSETFPFLGMPKESDFILYGPELDKTMGMRNYLTYNLARASGHYATQTVYAEVFLVNDGNPLSPKDYNGIYIAEEKVKRDKNRVNITKLTPPNLSGGYLFLYDNDNINEGDVTFGPLAGWEHPFLIKDPKTLLDGGAWLLNYLSNFESALNADDWLQRNGSASYRSFIDMAAFKDFFLLVELTKSPDGYRGSTFLHKDKDGVLVPGPVWDYNEAYGMCCGYPIDGWQRGGLSGPGTSGGSAISPEGWRFNICADAGRCLVEPRDGTAVWYRRLWLDPEYRQGAARRWMELRQGPWSNSAIQSGMIDAVAANIRDAAARNYERYDFLGGIEVWESEVSKLKSWLEKHLEWLDAQFSKISA